MNRLNNTPPHRAPFTLPKAAFPVAFGFFLFGRLLLIAGPASAVDCNSFRLWTFNIRFDNGFACSPDLADSNKSSDPLRILRGDVAASSLLNNSCPQPGDVAAGSLPLSDSFAQVGATEGGTYHGFSGGTSGSRIDHVLHTEDAFLPYQAVIRTDSYDSSACDAALCYPSDHYAVDVSFRIPLTDVWVDLNRNTVLCEAGTTSEEFATLEAAVQAVRPNGTLHIRAGSTGTKAIVLDRPMTLVAEGGSVVIGAP